MEEKSIKGWTVHFTKNFGKDDAEEIVHHSKLEDYWKAKKEAIQRLKLFPNDENTISDEFNIKFNEIINLDNDESRVVARPELYTTKKINKYYHLFFGDYEHKKFFLYEILGTWIGIIALPFLLYYLNLKDDFGLFDNIGFILVYIFIYFAISIIHLTIYSWFYTDQFDDVKENIQLFIIRYLSFVNFFIKRLKAIKSTMGTILFLVVFLFLIYAGANYLIGFF